MRRHGHCTTLYETKIFVFGGILLDKYANWDMYCIELGKIYYNF